MRTIAALLKVSRLTENVRDPEDSVPRDNCPSEYYSQRAYENFLRRRNSEETSREGRSDSKEDYEI